MEENNNDFEIVDTDTIGFGKDEAFSHSSLVMTSLRKCLELGSKEMRTGWFNQKQDRQGNITRTYVDDTRKAFIEGVKTLLMIVACDLDEEADEKVKALLTKVSGKKDELIKQEEEAWGKLDLEDKMIWMEKGMNHIDGELSHPILKNKFIEFELDIYRNIVAEVSKLTERLDYYKGQMLTA